MVDAFEFVFHVDIYAGELSVQLHFIVFLVGNGWSSSPELKFIDLHYWSNFVFASISDMILVVSLRILPLNIHNHRRQFQQHTHVIEPLVVQSDFNRVGGISICVVDIGLREGNVGGIFGMEVLIVACFSDGVVRHLTARTNLSDIHISYFVPLTSQFCSVKTFENSVRSELVKVGTSTACHHGQ